MATVCVGCGLSVDAEGKIRLDPNGVEQHLEASYQDEPGSLLPTTFDTAIGPTLCLTMTNGSDCRTMLVRAMIEGSVKLGWEVGTEVIFVVPEFSIDGGSTFTGGGRVGIEGPATTWTEGRYQSLSFNRQVATLAPGATIMVCMRYRVRTENSVTASCVDLGMVFTLDGLFID